MAEQHNDRKQLSDFQRQVIVLFKTENPTWGLTKCASILPDFFAQITRNQFSNVVDRLKRDGSLLASARKKGTGPAKRISDEDRTRVKELAVSPVGRPNRHLSQREIAVEMGLSKGSVFNILSQSKLKCYRRVKCNILTEQHEERRMNMSLAMADRFDHSWKNVWFSDEAHFGLRAPLNSQNERIYREVNVKTDIPNEDLLIEVDKMQPSVMCYAAVSWYGRTELRFVEGEAAGQGDVPPHRRKKKRINQQVYCEEMCPQMFEDIRHVMRQRPWTWQQDGAKAHTAKATVDFLRNTTPDFIAPEDWPAKSPDLNVMDYCVWSLLLAALQNHRHELDTIDQLKDVLLNAWNSIPQTTIQSATGAWVSRLRRCHAANGRHFEHLS